MLILLGEPIRVNDDEDDEGEVVDGDGEDPGCACSVREHLKAKTLARHLNFCTGHASSAPFLGYQRDKKLNCSSSEHQENVDQDSHMPQYINMHFIWQILKLCNFQIKKR